VSLDVSALLSALALVMVIEGLLPFAAPSAWRRMLFTVAQFEDRSLRLMGAASIVTGLVLLQII
jgi:uncharacterized protein YjeT (DUF2065 family)